MVNIMKVGVFLGTKPPTLGGGFTFQDDIFQALLELDTKHSFVIFSDMTEAQIGALTPNRLTFISLRRAHHELTRARLVETMAGAAAKLPIVRNWLRVTHTPWLAGLVRDLGIHIMWFICPDYREFDIPYIFTPLDLQHRLQPWFPEVSITGEWHGREKFYATAISAASMVLVGTAAGKAEVVQFYRVPEERVKVIPLPTPAFALRSPADCGRGVLGKFNIPEQYLFYPAQFWPHKNHVGLLLAVNRLRREYGIKVPVVFVGSDMGNLQYVRLVVNELDLVEQVHFLGFVSREDLVGLYRNAFALTFLTFFGPDNLPPLEAFALGCPVIASKVSGVEEQLGDAALLVDAKNEKEIADAIKRLREDPMLRDSLVSRGRARASKWTACDYIKRVLSLVDEFDPIRRCWGPWSVD